MCLEEHIPGPPSFFNHNLLSSWLHSTYPIIKGEVMSKISIKWQNSSNKKTNICKFHSKGSIEVCILSKILSQIQTLSTE